MQFRKMQPMMTSSNAWLSDSCMHSFLKALLGAKQKQELVIAPSKLDSPVSSSKAAAADFGDSGSSDLGGEEVPSAASPPSSSSSSSSSSPSSASSRAASSSARRFASVASSFLIVSATMTYVSRMITNSKFYTKTPFFFECFPYVCPEPVLVKTAFLYINGSRIAFSYLKDQRANQDPHDEVEQGAPADRTHTVKHHGIPRIVVQDLKARHKSDREVVKMPLNRCILVLKLELAAEELHPAHSKDEHEQADEHADVDNTRRRDDNHAENCTQWLHERNQAEHTQQPARKRITFF
jgi:hypothetical protein